MCSLEPQPDFRSVGCARNAQRSYARQGLKGFDCGEGDSLNAAGGGGSSSFSSASLLAGGRAGGGLAAAGVAAGVGAGGAAGGASAGGGAALTYSTASPGWVSQAQQDPYRLKTRS